MAKAASTKPPFKDRIKQIGMAFSYTAKRDKKFLPLAVIAGLAPILLAVLFVVFAPESWRGGTISVVIWVVLGVLGSLLAVLAVLNLRANSAMMNEAEGQPGAAAAILQTMRGDWRVTPAAQATTQQDFVHRVIGKPGVVLIAEGSPGRVRGLLGQEKKRLSRVVGETPIYDFIIGTGEGLLSVRKLRSTLVKLPRNITGKQVNALDKRLTALSTRPQMPKGPIPKNMRPKGMNRALRGR
ncbi:MAG: DUF4191 domain-containing protein [Micromonosporaceae bacterium]